MALFTCLPDAGSTGGRLQAGPPVFFYKRLLEHRVVFEADLPALEPMHDWKERLVQKLDAPTAGAPLCSLLSPKQHIVLLVEDNTRHTPVKEILPP